MPKISTDSQKIQELLSRGVENIYPNKEFLEKALKSGKRLSLYLGIDPTGPTLHIGHIIPMEKLRQFQELGHKIILLIGDFTGMVGDPTDKTATRKVLSREQVLKNAKDYKKQAATILDFKGTNKVELKYNSAWHKKTNFSEVMKLSSNFTVQQLLERDMFQERIKAEKPIHLHEFMYPVLQAYDSVAMDVDGEVGGNDQTFNMLSGRTLMKLMTGKEKFVITTKLLVDPSGKKMGKTEGNMLALNDSAKDMFGKVMSWTDGMIVEAYELCTRLPMS
ncbi:MAG: tyrosine--tRNA ligase, partial [bacterium]|nr:tyrosine--tRNA ligase [bacterium]